jgi:methionyl-tRNA formyltransferase
MSASGPRVLFFGTRGAFSVPPLAALLDAGVPVAAVILPPDPAGTRGVRPPPIHPIATERMAGALPMLEPEPTLLDLAREHGLPAFALARPDDPMALATLKSLKPDLICVACFPRVLPPSLLQLPRRGCLNLHPSLLPRHRGPAPLFWTFYHDERSAGVTVHIMDHRVDSGDLLLQEPIPILPGTTGPALERACAEAGGRLLVTAARAWAEGSLAPRAQPEAEATHAPWPTPRDLEIPITWTAARAFRFTRGVSTWYPLTMRVPGPLGTVILRIQEALGVEPDDALPSGQTYRQSGNEAWVRCHAGILRVSTLTSPDRRTTI